ncbi:hypothetical protein ABK040_000894 [Willaertia magna]
MSGYKNNNHEREDNDDDEEELKETQEEELAQQLEETNQKTTITNETTLKRLRISLLIFNFLVYLLSLLAALGVSGICFVVIYFINKAESNEISQNEKIILTVACSVIGIFSLMRGIIGFIVPYNKFSKRLNIILECCFSIILVLEIIVQVVLWVIIVAFIDGKENNVVGSFIPQIISVILYYISVSNFFILRLIIKTKLNSLQNVNTF